MRVSAVALKQGIFTVLLSRLRPHQKLSYLTVLLRKNPPQNLAQAGAEQPPQPQEYAELAVNIDIDASG